MQQTLYERLGGEVALTAAVDLFYARVLGDPDLAHFFQGVSMPRLKGHQRAFLRMALGGGGQYTGMSMDRAHSHMRIDQRHFDAVAGHLVATLESLGVPEEMIGEVVALIAPLAKVVVNTPTQAPCPPPMALAASQSAADAAR